MKVVLTWVLLLLSLSPVLAQRMQDVLSLKNGWILRGTLRPLPGDSVELETPDRQVFRFAQAEVRQTTQERATTPGVRYKKRGFQHYTELGPLAISNRASNGTTTSAFSLQTVNGYRFSPAAFVGLGAGVDLFAVQTFVPVFVSFRSDLTSQGTRIPFLFFDGGYSFNATSNDVPGQRFRGGPLLAAGLGLKILFQGNTGFLLSVGYRFQRTQTESLLLGTRTEDFNRLALRAGFSF